MNLFSQFQPMHKLKTPMGDAFYSERQANSSGFHSIYTIIYLEDT